jgi:hypothetical protein
LELYRKQIDSSVSIEIRFNRTYFSARVAFKNFGFRTITHGRPVRDDYAVGDLREEDVIFDEFADYSEGGFPYKLRSDVVGLDGEMYADDGRPIGDYSGAVARPVGFGGGLPSYKAPSSLLQAVSLESGSANASTDGDDSGAFSSNSNGRLVDVTGGLGAESIMVRAAASAADFNSKLRAQRKRKLLDVHTNIDQTPLNKQPSLFIMERSTDSTLRRSNGIVVETVLVGSQLEKDGVWTQLKDFMDMNDESDFSKYPVSLVDGQYQGLYSM